MLSGGYEPGVYPNFKEESLLTICGISKRPLEDYSEMEAFAQTSGIGHVGTDDGHDSIVKLICFRVWYLITLFLE